MGIKLRLKYKFIFILFFLFSAKIFAQAAPDIYPFKHAQQEKQFAQLIQNFRCLVCQNESLADSNTSLAKDLRAQIYRMVNQQKSSQEITNYLVKRYGDFVLYQPPVMSLTYFLWGTPIVLLLLGFYLVFRASSKRPLS